MAEGILYSTPFLVLPKSVKHINVLKIMGWIICSCSKSNFLRLACRMCRNKCWKLSVLPSWGLFALQATLEVMCRFLQKIGLESWNIVQNYCNLRIASSVLTCQCLCPWPCLCPRPCMCPSSLPCMCPWHVHVYVWIFLPCWFQWTTFREWTSSPIFERFLDGLYPVESAIQFSNGTVYKYTLNMNPSRVFESYIPPV